MITLILDTSSEKGIVALARHGELLFSRPLAIMGKNSTTLLMDAVQQGLGEIGIDLSGLGYIACGTGPGFFTGIRIASAWAKGLALGLGIPLVGFTSLAGFVPDQSGPLASIIDARVGGAYLLVHGRFNEESGEQPTVAYYTYEELEKKITGLPIFTPSRGKMPFENAVEIFPNPHQLVRLIEKKIQNKEFFLNGELPLSYLRPSV